MGAKLSKKKKGYCLGAGKDGESTDTTEVEQKETENQEGQKDAAEPKGDKTPTDQSQSNGINEETKDKKSDAEVTTGEATKEESNQDQNPEPSAEQEKVEEKDQPQGTEDHEKGKSAASEQVCDKEKEVKSASEDKTKTECEVKDKPTQESKLEKENEGSDCKQSHSSETKQLAPVQDEASVTIVKAEVTGRTPAPVETEEKTTEVPTQASKSVVEPEKVPEKVEPSAPESVTVTPVPEPVAKAVVLEPVIKIELVEPEVVKPAQLTEEAKSEAVAAPEKVDSALPKSDTTSEPVCASLPEPVEPATKEPEVAVEPEPTPVPEPVVAPALPQVVPEIRVETVVPEQPIAHPEKNVLPEKDPELVTCPKSEQISETKQELTSEPLPPKATEVPDETAAGQGHSKNQESLESCGQAANAVMIQPPTTDADSIKPPSKLSEQPVALEVHVLQNGPSENSAEDVHVEVHPISTELKVEDKGEQKEVVKETGGLDKQPPQQENQVVKEDFKTPTDVLVTPKTENNAKETHDESQHCNSEDKTENHDPSADEIKNETKPSAPEILEKHGVGNGLPIKEEIKVRLENKCDHDLHDLNGQSESNEIQVCNE